MKPLYNKDLDGIFRERMEDMEVHPSSRVWDAVQNDLENIRPTVHSYYLKWMGTAAAILAVLFTSLWLSELAEEEIPVGAQDAISVSPSPISAIFRDISAPIQVPATTGEGMGITGNTSHAAVVAKEHDSPTSKRSVAKAKDTEGINYFEKQQLSIINSEEESLKQDFLRTLHAEKIGNELNAEPEQLPIYSTTSNELIILEDKISGLHIGPFVSLQSTRILDSELDIDRMPTYKPGMNADIAYGVAIGYDFSARSGIEVDIIVQSNEGQTFRVLTETGWRPKEIGLNYLRIPVMYKYRMSKVGFGNTPVALNYLIGVSYGRLNQVNIDKEISFVEPRNYNQHEWGITAGIEYDIYFSSNYFLTLGGRAMMNSRIGTLPTALGAKNTDPQILGLAVTAKFNYLFKPRQ